MLQLLYHVILNFAAESVKKEGIMGITIGVILLLLFIS